MVDIAAFLKELGPVVGRRAFPVGKPLILLDESVPSRVVDAACLDLCQSGICSGSVELWSQLRELADGSRFFLEGGPPRNRRIAGLGIPVKGWSRPDTDIAQLLVAHFYTNDRLILLTENKRRDRDGLWELLHRDIKPALEADDSRRLGLLVLLKDGSATHTDYAQSVIARLQHGTVSHGFALETLPTAA